MSAEDDNMNAPADEPAVNEPPEEQAVAPGDSRKHSKFGEDEDQADIGRDRWSSRLAFYLAAIGSAIGFGNVWRFPALAADYGGGAFFIPYLMALFIVGLPVLILEIALGQYYQCSVVGCLGSLHARLRGSGVSSVVCAFILVTYYSMLLAWVTNAFFDSFTSSSPWGQANITGEEAVGYFYDDIIGMQTLGKDLRPTRVVGANAGYSALVWVCIYLCLAFGMKWTGRVAYITMGLPIIFLFIFLGRAVALEGSGEGIKQYVGIWDMSVLTERGDVWSTAVSQIFFSLSVTFGTMPAYGSACPRGEPAFLNATVIGLSNSMFSIIAGFAVFAALGHLAYLEGKEVSEIPYRSFGLVFGTWPVVFSTLPGGVHWVRLLFINLFLLGIDSAFSILEAPLAVALDYVGFRSIHKWKMSLALSVLAYLFSIIYATDAGLIFLDSVDWYINFVFLLLGFFETFGAGWLFGIEKQVAMLGLWPVLSYMFANFGAVIVASGLWFGLKDNAVWGGFVGLVVVYLVFFGITLYLLKLRKAQKPELTWNAMMCEISFGNIFDLIDELKVVVGFVPKLWGFLIKQLIPHILLILFINLAQTQNPNGESMFGHYEGYVMWPFQVLGFMIVGFAAIIILAGFTTPKIYESFDTTANGAGIRRIERGLFAKDSVRFVPGVGYQHGIEGAVEDEVSGKPEAEDEEIEP